MFNRLLVILTALFTATIATAVTPQEAESAALHFFANELNGIVTTFEDTHLVRFPFGTPNTLKIRIDMLLIIRDDVLTAPLPWTAEGDLLTRGVCLKPYGFVLVGFVVEGNDTYIYPHSGDAEQFSELTTRLCGYSL